MIFSTFKRLFRAKVSQFIILMFCLLPLVLSSQEKTDPGWMQLGVNAGPVMPRGEFKQEYPNLLLAGGVDFMVGIPRLNLMFGAEYKRVNMETESNSLDDTIPTGGGIYALGMDTDAKTRMDVFHLSSRFVPWKEAKISPYLGVSGGFKTVTLSWERTARYKNEDEKLDEDKQAKFALSYGGRIGVLYKLQEQLMLDVSASWNGSSKTSYPKNIKFDSEGRADGDMIRAKTDMILFSVGVVFVNLP
ncbi:MAG: hypothetical protein K9J21_00805 [Bacteroidales bacterium]|nr:hypothetical protein [Bacteroidales bacterium]